MYGIVKESNNFSAIIIDENNFEYLFLNEDNIENIVLNVGDKVSFIGEMYEEHDFKKGRAYFVKAIIEDKDYTIGSFTNDKKLH